ncbi:ribonuclease HII [Candidatus Venteria ishoeyi]|uniref:ribonuclease HII n=1 Tax=Candidatus Venteria ishoeyi TaxID=1899563 RepID=UPI00387EB358
MKKKQSLAMPDLILENELWANGQLRVIGVDEVGRGCLSGPVLTAAVMLPPDTIPLAGVTDSKKLSLKQREAIYDNIKQQALAFAIGAASVAEIDRINILNATYLAMQRAMSRLQPWDHALIDGRDTKKHDLGVHTAVIGGDQKSYSIACASIIAKVVRDRLMRHLAVKNPGYGWETNAGYGTKAHLSGLEKLGATRWHRRSFAPVKKFI